MKEKELNISLREHAISCGICNKFLREWQKDWDLQKMADQFYRGIDFFIDKRFISNNYMKQYFDVEFRRENGILVDDRYSLLNPKRAILVGESKSTIRFNSFNTATIYVLDESNVTITTKDHAIVTVHVFGKAQVCANKFDDSKISIISHNPECVIISDKNIAVKTNYDYLKKANR